MSRHVADNLEGISFFEFSAAAERVCEEMTNEHLAKLDPIRQECLTKMGTLLALMYKFATCYWGCHKGPHTLEMFMGRIVCEASGVMRLMRCGYYDEALGVIRAIAEIGNLLWLFGHDPQHIEQWVHADAKTRIRDYGPASVRKKLEPLSGELPTTANEYSYLCEAGIHVTPATMPQMHNDQNVATLGTFPQIKGIKLCLDLLFEKLAFAGGGAAKLAQMDVSHSDKTHSTEVCHAAAELLRTVGRLEDRSKTPI